MTNTNKFVAYYRVSTNRQGKSGLGLAAQNETVANYCMDRGKIIAEFTEIESGKNNDRVKLKRAIELAKQQQATLLIAKLDRLSRNAAFIMTLKDSGVSFVACDMPNANTLTIGIFASMAQWERERISQRIKEALRQAKKKGKKLGNPQNLTRMAAIKGGQSRKTKAINEPKNKEAYRLIKVLKEQGNSYRIIAERLNSEGLRTVRGKLFHITTVARIYKMYQAA